MTTPLPRIDFSTFCLSISSSAYMGMGISPYSTGKETQIDFEMAKQNIDVLEMIEEKTRGNRTPQEEKLVTQLLFDVRMKFIEIEKKATKSNV